VNQPPLDVFLAACGSTEPIRVGVGSKDATSPQVRSFRQPFLVIGRRPESDLMLDHWQVSRRHAYLQLIQGRYYGVDLGSRTGTHGGDATERSGWLEDGRSIQIGPFTVRPEGPGRVARDARPLPGVTWELPGRAIGQAIWRMDRDLVLVGRSPACRIRLVEPDVSKFHCSLVLTRLGVWVVDLLGHKGVHVNGEPVRCARLEEGDELRVGRHSIRPRYDSPPPPLDRASGPASRSGRGEIAPYAPPPPESSRDLPAPARPAPGPAPGREIAPFVDRAGVPADPTVSALVQQFGAMQQQMFDQFHQTMMMMFEGFAALHRETSGSLREELEEVRKLSAEIESLRAETARLAEAVARPPERAERPRPPANGHGPADRRAPPAPEPPGSPEPSRRATPPPPDPHVDIHSHLLKRLSTIESERQNRWQKILGLMSNKA